MLKGKYDFLAQDRIVYGVPAADAVLTEVENYGAKRVFIVSSQTLSRRTDVISDIKRALGERYCGLFDECVAHVPRESVLVAAARVREAEPDLIVTVGGGTPIDTVKVLLLCLAEGITKATELDNF